MGFVYSTNPNFSFEEERKATETLPPAQQKLKVRLDTKQRAGKAVTLIDGTGGSVKDGEIIVQGDQREKVMQWLLKNGYKNVKKT